MSGEIITKETTVKIPCFAPGAGKDDKFLHPPRSPAKNKNYSTPSTMGQQFFPVAMSPCYPHFPPGSDNYLHSSSPSFLSSALPVLLPVGGCNQVMCMPVSPLFNTAPTAVMGSLPPFSGIVSHLPTNLQQTSLVQHQQQLLPSHNYPPLHHMTGSTNMVGNNPGIAPTAGEYFTKHNIIMLASSSADTSLPQLQPTAPSKKTTSNPGFSPSKSTTTKESPLGGEGDQQGTNEAPQEEKIQVGDEPPVRPKRALNAYNLFFQYERTRLREEGIRRDTLVNGKRRRDRQARAGISFETMAKTISQRWKATSPEVKKYFEAQALQDKRRYADELQRYKLAMLLWTEQSKNLPPT